MGFLKLLTNKEFWVIILRGIILYILLFLVVIIGLKIYTHHGKSFPVPDFKGVSIDRAEEIADSRDLFIEIVDSTFVPYLPKGSVIEQYPHPNVNVKKNRTIFLTINAFNQAKVEMPNVVGVSYRQGKTTLESRGLRVGRLIYKPDFAKNNILNQMYKGKDIEPETEIVKGSSIDLILGNGYSRSNLPVPDLKKSIYNQAISEINDSYFNVGRTYFDTTIHNYTDTLNAFVWKQRPEYSSTARLMMGAKIDMWLTLDKSKVASNDTESDSADNQFE